MDLCNANGVVLEGDGALDTGHRNVLLLALCQAAFVSTATLTATVGSLAGHALAQNKALATAPSAALVIGTALSTIPVRLRRPPTTVISTKTRPSSRVQTISKTRPEAPERKKQASARARMGAAH